MVLITQMKLLFLYVHHLCFGYVAKLKTENENENDLDLGIWFDVVGNGCVVVCLSQQGPNILLH